MKAWLDATVGDRNPAGGRHRQRAGDPGHDAYGHPGLHAGEHLLPAAAEHERIAALEPDHRLSPAGPADHLILDRGLATGWWYGVLPTSISSAPAASSARSSVGGQPVVEDHIGLAQRGARLEGEQAGPSGTAADQRDAGLARAGSSVMLSTCRCPASSRIRSRRPSGRPTSTINQAGPISRSRAGPVGRGTCRCTDRSTDARRHAPRDRAPAWQERRTAWRGRQTPKTTTLRPRASRSICMNSPIGSGSPGEQCRQPDYPAVSGRYCWVTAATTRARSVRNPCNASLPSLGPSQAAQPTL